MLKNTFCHLPKVGVLSESRIWESGIESWDDLFECDEDLLPLSKLRLKKLRADLEPSYEFLDDPLYFQRLMPAGQDWRLYYDFRESVAFVDIETTGLGMGYGSAITTIALFDGHDVRHYVNGENLRDFRDDIENYKLLVTYNGKCFDVPFIEGYFGFQLEMAHIDLRYTLGRLGYHGGLKGCEHQFGIDRGELEGVDGYFAVLLWNDYVTRGNLASLETLIAYNIEDVVNLRTLAAHAFNECVAQTPFADSRVIPIPALRPNVPFQPDIATVERLRYENGIFPTISSFG